MGRQAASRWPLPEESCIAGGRIWLGFELPSVECRCRLALVVQKSNRFEDGRSDINVRFCRTILQVMESRADAGKAKDTTQGSALYPEL